ARRRNQGARGGGLHEGDRARRPHHRSPARGRLLARLLRKGNERADRPERRQPAPADPGAARPTAGREPTGGKPTGGKRTGGKPTGREPTGSQPGLRCVEGFRSKINHRKIGRGTDVVGPRSESSSTGATCFAVTTHAPTAASDPIPNPKIFRSSAPSCEKFKGTRGAYFGPRF